MSESNPYASPVSTAPPLSPAEEKQWAILTHVLGIFFGPVSAAALYFLFRDRGPFVKAHTTTEWNFQLTVLIASGVAFAVSFASILANFAERSTAISTSMSLFFVGYFLMFVIRIVALVLGIVAARAASRGEYYTYPFAIQFAR